MYYLYIVKCSDETLYTGITTDIVRRVLEHNNDIKGAKYTKARRPVELVYSLEFANRSLAQRAESEIKKLTRAQKISLIAGVLNA
ncbi:MAG: GIY-YIG nuclease family protein [bacterium]